MFKTKIMLYSLALLLIQLPLQAADGNPIVTPVEQEETDKQILHHLVNNESVEKDRIQQIRPEVTGECVQELLNDSNYEQLASLLNAFKVSDYKLPVECRARLEVPSIQQRRQLRIELKTISKRAAQLCKKMSAHEGILDLIGTWDEESDEEPEE